MHEQRLSSGGVDLAEAFRNFVKADPFPCVGAKSALKKGQLSIVVARDLQSNWDDSVIYRNITALVERYRDDNELFQSFVVIFEQPVALSEKEFEYFLWKRAESLSNKDAWFSKDYDPRVSSNPDDAHFSLSFDKAAFFIVGLHPNASRASRRFERPALVFNIHDQFERLRDEGKYEGLRSAIIKRDDALCGSPNPMLQRHGQGSEARQYSGRETGDNWTCPFHPVSRS